MRPRQPVQVARQAFTPEGFRRVRDQRVEERPRRNFNGSWPSDSTERNMCQQRNSFLLRNFCLPYICQRC
jgi:hypothetical protein